MQNEEENPSRYITASAPLFLLTPKDFILILIKLFFQNGTSAIAFLDGESNIWKSINHLRKVRGDGGSGNRLLEEAMGGREP